MCRSWFSKIGRCWRATVMRLHRGYEWIRREVRDAPLAHSGRRLRFVLVVGGPVGLWVWIGWILTGVERAPPSSARHTRGIGEFQFVLR
jgi:hypothetical protein